MGFNFKTLLLLLVAGTLPALPWLESFSGYIAFIALIPLLALEDAYYNKQYSKSVVNVFFNSYFIFAIWNLISFWWAAKATVFGLLAPLLINSGLYAFMFTFYHWLRKKIPDKGSFYLLPAVWLSFEYFHHHWDLSFPWLSLGNALGKEISSIQWYEYTGVLGGSLWILVINILIYKLLMQSSLKLTLGRIGILILLVSIPLVFSYYLLGKQQVSDKYTPVIIVQPNINPYTEKFAKPQQLHNIRKMVQLVPDSMLTPGSLVIFPETAISAFVKESDFDTDSQFLLLRTLLDKQRDIAIITGALTYSIDSSSLQTPDTKPVYHFFNSAVFLDSAEIQVYHKQKLLPGAEKMPFTSVLRFLQNFKINLPGGITWYSTVPGVEKFSTSNANISTVICYESVYGDYFRSVDAGLSDFIVIITNDGWWGNTTGHIRHLRFAQTRAIEYRKNIARCANTGISAFINYKGEIEQLAAYDTISVLKSDVYNGSRVTFYAKHGDWIGKIAAFLLFLAVIWGLFLKIRHKKVLS